MTILELRDALNKIIEDGNGNCEVVLDSEGQTHGMYNIQEGYMWKSYYINNNLEEDYVEEYSNLNEYCDNGTYWDYITEAPREKDKTRTVFLIS